MDNLNPVTQPELNAPAVGKKSYWLIALVVILVAIIFLIIGAAAGYFLIGNFAPKQTATSTVSDVSSTTGEVSVSEIAWSEPKEIAALKNLFLPPTADSAAIDSYYGQAYLVGTFSTGKYQGAELILLSAYPEGPAMYPGYFHFAKQGDKYTLLAKNSDTLGDGYFLDKSKFSVDNDYLIKELDLPASLTGPQGQKLARDEFAKAFFSLNNLKLAFVDPAYGNVYTTNSNIAQPRTIFDRAGFYIRLSDGTTAVYKVTGEILDEATAPKIVWSDGKTNSQTYSFTDRYGCGSGNYASIVDISDSDLIKIGQTAAGESVFAPKDAENYYYKDLYNNKYQVEPGREKMAYQEFIATKPLFFWRDSFGRLIKFASTKFQPLAECGKPVIYLYPTVKSEVSVKVEPQGGFSYTEPAYNDGWKVVAEPDGRLTDLSSGQNYPYLFWEGRGGLYATPNRGFTVKRSEVKSFLIEKLSEYNLNEQEIKDFLEFWLPKMQAKPYYFITFLGTAEMDRLAPLKINPAPDTVIRVLMDFTPLDQAVPSVGYKITAPARQGFTVIEWGGVLRQ